MAQENITKSTLYKIENAKNVTTDILLRIYDVQMCDILEIVERVTKKDCCFKEYKIFK